MKIIKTKDWKKIRKKEQWKKTKRDQIILFIGLFLFFSTLIYTCIQDARTFREAGGFNTLIKGIVVKKGYHKRDKNYYWIDYEYEGELYKKDYTKAYDSNYNLGDTINVLINDKIPEHGCVILEYR